MAALLPARPALVQYRNKLADAAARRDQATRLLALCRAAGVPLIINDDLALALAVGADGVHLGRDDGDPAEARRALGPGPILGVSCYDEWPRAEAGAAAGVDYLAFGAVYPSPTKPHAPRASFELLARAKRDLGLPVAAINLGATRADAELDIKLPAPCDEALAQLSATLKTPAGSYSQ